MQTLRRHLMALPLLAALPRAFAHGEQPHHAGPVVKEQKPWGIAGDPKNVRKARRCDCGRSTPAR